MIFLGIYLILSWYFGRKNPMFYFILPFALQQGPASFIAQDISVGGKYLLTPAERIFTDVNFFIAFFIAYFFIGLKKKPVVHGLGNKLIMFFMIYLGFLWLLSFANPSEDIADVFLTGRQMLYLPLSYYLWLTIFHNITREDFEQFLKMTLYVTPVSTALYILNSSGAITVFDNSRIYSEIEGYGATSFFRDFMTIPIWLMPALLLTMQSFLFSTFKVPKFLLVLNLIILPIGVLFTFTRSVVLSIILQLVFILILSFIFNKRSRFKVLGWLPVLVGFLFASGFAIQTFYPSQYEYFSERFLSAKKEGKSEQNVDIRMQYLEEATRITDETSTIFGAGISRRFYPRMDDISQAWTGDSTIPFYLIHTGLLGVLMLYAMLIYFVVDSIKYYIKTKDWLVGFLSANFLSIVITSVIMGGGMLMGSIWTLMNYAAYMIIRYNQWKVPEEEELTELELASH